MTADVLGAAYAGLSLFLFVYALRHDRALLYSYAFAAALNIFPVAGLGYLGMEELRFMRVPFAYFPTTAAVAATFCRGGFGPGQPHLRRLYLLCGLFLLYMPVQTFFLSEASDWRSFMPYYAMWAMNVGVIFPLARIARRVGREQMFRTCRLVVGVVWAGTLIGLIRHSAGLFYGANFMPLVNPNGTVTVVVMTWPLLLACRDTGRIPAWLFYAALVTLPLCSLLITSRMGFFGTWAALGTYYWLRRERPAIAHAIRYLTTIALLGVLGWGVLASPLGEPLRLRVVRTWVSIGMLSELDLYDHTVADYRRAKLVSMSLEVIRRNLLWGTGVGLENYADELDRIFLFNVDRAKPHCFYLSCLAELGVFGYVLCLLVFYGIWRGLSPPIHLRDKSFETTVVLACFRSIFVAVMVTFMINEYVGYSLIWAFFGMGLGMSAQHSDSGEEGAGPSDNDPAPSPAHLNRQPRAT